MGQVSGWARRAAWLYFGMTVLDWGIVAFTLALAIWGYEQGLIVGAFTLSGFVLGAFAGSRLAPALLSGGAHSPYAPMLAALGALMFGAAVAVSLEGLGVGVRARLVRGPTMHLADGAGGAVLIAAVALGLTWVFGAVALHAPGAGELRRGRPTLADPRPPQRPSAALGADPQRAEQGRPAPQCPRPAGFGRPPSKAIVRDQPTGPPPPPGPGFAGGGPGFVAGTGTSVPPETAECPNCHASNVAGAKFCASCGTSLAPPKVVCANCEAENPVGARFCANCGQPLGPQPVHCASCGTEVAADARFCPGCGTAVAPPSPAVSRYSVPARRRRTSSAPSTPCSPGPEAVRDSAAAGAAGAAVVGSAAVAAASSSVVAAAGERRGRRHHRRHRADPDCRRHLLHRPPSDAVARGSWLPAGRRGGGAGTIPPASDSHPDSDSDSVDGFPGAGHQLGARRPLPWHPRRGPRAGQFGGGRPGRDQGPRSRLQ